MFYFRFYWHDFPTGSDITLGVWSVFWSCWSEMIYLSHSLNEDRCRGLSKTWLMCWVYIYTRSINMNAKTSLKCCLRQQGARRSPVNRYSYVTPTSYSLLRFHNEQIIKQWDKPPILFHWLSPTFHTWKIRASSRK